MTRLEECLKQACSAPILLVACDLDGTLAPIAHHPSAARPNTAAIEALRLLAAAPHTHVALISGRSRRDVTALVGSVDSIHFVGSHGAEPEDGREPVIPIETAELLARIRTHSMRACDAVPGAWAESKPLGVAVHVRQAPPDAARVLLEDLRRALGSLDGVRTVVGKGVLEFVLGGGDKGLALRRLKHRTCASSVVFLGDDVTDEDAFGVLGAADLGVKVGEGATKATHRVESPDAVAELLARLAIGRRDWLASRAITPIDHHWLLSDQRTCALIDPMGGLVWFCAPRLDSSALFAELLGGPSAGYWDITAANCAQAPTQQWTGDNFVLRTRWNTGPSGSELTVTDYLDTSVGRAFQRSGRTDLVRVLSGHGRAVVRFAPRLDFGRAPTRLEIVPNGLRILGAPEPTVLHAPGVAWQIAEEGPHQTASAEIALSGHEHVLELRCGTASTRSASLPEPERRRQSERFWSTWAESLTVPALHAGIVRRSALALRALCHGPTGAIAAAATTSLPEQLGGVRNWDYRYCWPRDAALAAGALIRLGNTGVALRLLDWLAGVVSGLPSPDRLRPIYDMAGHDLGSEAQIAELTGYGQSRPVRIGNAAAAQVQIDVFGPVVDLAASVAERGAPITPEVWRLVESMVRAVSHRWREPDHGIWEIRATPRHHLHSKVMCWHAVDRAIAVAALALGTDKPDWAALRDEIAADARANGWNERLGFYTGWYGGDTLDAGALLLATSGFLDPADPRLHTTIDAITRSLARGPLVMRYQGDDGLPGIEGAMLICSFWLVEALSIIGRHSQAEGIFHQLCEFVPSSGLLSEQIDPAGPTALGNFPQAYSHLGLINAVVRLARHRDHGAAGQGAHR